MGGLETSANWSSDRLGHGEHVQQGVDLHGAGGPAVLGGRVTDEVHGIPLVDEVRGDGGACGHGPLERARRARAVVTTGSGVETSRRADAPGGSWRTISSPVLAVAGQSMRRRSSPSR